MGNSNSLAKQDSKANIIIAQLYKNDIPEKFNFDSDTVDFHNQTQEFEGGIWDKYNTINPSHIGIKARFSLANNKSVQNLKIAKKKLSSKSKGKLNMKNENSTYENDNNKTYVSKANKAILPSKKFKKSTYYDLSINKINLTSTFDNGSTTMREVLTNRRFEPKSNKNKKLYKSSSVLKFEKQRNSSFSQRKSSVGTISTSKLCHLPKDFWDPRTIKNWDKTENVSSKLRKAIFSQKCINPKSGSVTSKNRNTVSFSKKSQQYEGKKMNQNKSWITINPSSTSMISKIKLTSQPWKPVDEKIDTLPEYEGSSFKTSKMSVLKNTPQETKLRKSPLSFIEKRHLSFHHSFIQKSDESELLNLEFQENKHYWVTDTKDKSLNARKIEEAIKSPEKSQRSQIKNKTNILKFEKQQLTKTQQVIINDTSIDNINYNSDENNETVKKQLDFSQNSSLKKADNNEENIHPNIPPLNINRAISDKSKILSNRIPIGNMRLDQIQKSEPQKKSPNDNELIFVQWPIPMTHRKLEEANLGSSSNDKSNKNTKSDKHSTWKI